MEIFQCPHMSCDIKISLLVDGYLHFLLQQRGGTGTRIAAFYETLVSLMVAQDVRPLELDGCLCAFSFVSLSVSSGIFFSKDINQEA
jgi:hypothetical protein